jgi:predicted acylesterase/phospholipase RssA
MPGIGDIVLARAAVAIGIPSIGAIVGSAASAGDTSDVLRGATVRTAARKDERADKATSER